MSSGQSRPEYLLLVGDGTWNFRNSPRYNTLPVYMPPNLAWVDPWSGVIDSANSLAAVVGDDILPDLFVSRIPVNTSAELDAVVDKIIAYEAAPRQDWQRNLVFIADNVPDRLEILSSFRKISSPIMPSPASPRSAFTRMITAARSAMPARRSTHAITTTLNQTGTLLVNYIGHGAINRWSNESILIPARSQQPGEWRVSCRSSFR